MLIARDDAMGKVMRAIGLMSGTSMDGIDLALIETDGIDHVRRLGSASVAYPDDVRGRLRQAVADATSIQDRRDRPGCLGDVERDVTDRHAEAVLRFMGDQMLQPSAVDVIGFHGQTVLHRETLVPTGSFIDHRLGVAEERDLLPRRRMITVQLGDGPLLAQKAGVDVVYDLRGEDCELGGEGAPLVPVYHRALAAKVTERPIAFVNIGGVANVTWIGRDGALLAFDTGPGNALIDDWMLGRTGGARDDDGRLAATGRIRRRDPAAVPVTPPFLQTRTEIARSERLSAGAGSATCPPRMGLRRSLLSPPRALLRPASNFPSNLRCG